MRYSGAFFSAGMLLAYYLGPLHNQAAVWFLFVPVVCGVIVAITRITSGESL